MREMSLKTTAFLALLVSAAACEPEAPDPMRAATAWGSPAWEVRLEDSTAHWIGLHALDRNVVWAAGRGGRVARTTDGGATWTVVTVPGADSLQFRDAHAFSADEAFVLSIGNGPDSRIYATRDGGATWTESFRNADPDAFFDCFSFWDRERGFAFSDSHDGEFTLVRTTDGGRSWHRIDPAAVPDARAGEGAFAASGTCVATRAGGLGWFATGASGVDTRVIRTLDYGDTWTESVTPIASRGGTEGISSVAFADDARGAVFGGDFTRPDSVHANLAMTRDGGATWASAGPVPLGGAVFAGSAVPGTGASAWLAVAPTGSALSTDDGATWTRIDDTDWWTLSAAGPDAVWAAGPGRISRLVDRAR